MSLVLRHYFDIEVMVRFKMLIPRKKVIFVCMKLSSGSLVVKAAWLCTTVFHKCMGSRPAWRGFSPGSPASSHFIRPCFTSHHSLCICPSHLYMKGCKIQQPTNQTNQSFKTLFLPQNWKYDRRQSDKMIFHLSKCLV